MHTKAAIASVGGGKAKGPVPLTSFDIKLIQYKGGLYKLQEIIRILGILEKNLQPPSSTSDGGKENVLKKNKTIVPLITYILTLCEGHIFNILPMIRKRYLALCQFKFYKLQDFNPSLATSFIPIDFDFSEVTEDSFEEYRHNIYDNELQWKLLHYLKNLTVNTLSVYNKRLRQIQLEKTSNCNRPYEVTERTSKFMIEYVDDLVRPIEMGLSLDFAVLIKDKSKDTSVASFLKLQCQVIDKFVLFIDKKIFPNIKNYYNQINKYSNKTCTFSSLPFPEFTLHRIYALLLKVFDTLAIIISLVRCVYLPNKSYFQNCKTKLISKNVYQYEDMLDKIDKLCVEYTNKSFYNFKADLNSFTVDTISFIAGDAKKNNTISDLHKSFITRHVQLMRTTLQIVSKWSSMWKFIQKNIEGLEKFKDMKDDQLHRMLEERRSVDKLSHFEKLPEKKRISTIFSNNDNGAITSPLSSSASSTQSSRTSSLLSYSLHPDDIRMLNSKANLSVPKSKIGGSHGSATSPSSSVSSLSPNNTSRRSSVDRPKLLQMGMSPLSRNRSRTSNTSSPSVSRRSSIIERALVPGKIRPLSTVLDETIELPAEVVKTAVEQPVSVLKRVSSVKGRPRSSSLQTPKYSNVYKNSGHNTPDTKRSNSLEANDSLNQKLVQDTMKKLMSGSLGRHITHSDGTYSPTRSKPTSANRSRSSSVNSDHSVNMGYSSTSKLAAKISNGASNNNQRISSPLSSKFKKVETTSMKVKDSYDNSKSGQKLHFQDFESNNDKEGDYSEDNEGTNGSSSTQTSNSTIKKVRFVGVPPMSASENPRPKRKGWYKKPAVLHYPPVPPQVNISLRQKYNLEGVAFRTSLRETPEDEKKPSMLANLDEGLLAKKSPSTHKFGLNLRDRFRSS
ncbi:GLC7-interacting protein 4 [Monosporozyma unispora]|nr:protein phosphatase regulator gip4 [Kazachstania unispora]